MPEMTIDNVTDSTSWGAYVYQEAFEKEPDVFRCDDQWEAAEDKVIEGLPAKHRRRLEKLLVI